MKIRTGDISLKHTFRWATLGLKLPYKFILPLHNVGGNGEIELLVLEDPKTQTLGSKHPQNEGQTLMESLGQRTNPCKTANKYIFYVPNL